MPRTEVRGGQIADTSITDADVASANKDGTAITPSMRTLGTGSLQAASGSHTHDHNTLTNLGGGDPHTQYVMLNGRSGGQTISGGTTSGNTLNLVASAPDLAAGNFALLTNSYLAIYASNVLKVQFGAVTSLAVQLQSTLATGTAPIFVTSTTVCPSLNADMVDGLHATSFVVLTGRSGGQTLYGGTGANENLTLKGTSDSSKGQIIIDGGLCLPSYSLNNYAGAATLNDFALPLNLELIEFSCAATGLVITGFTGGTMGRVIVVENVGSIDIQLNHQDAGSSAANRFFLPGNANLLLQANASVTLWWDSNTPGWRTISTLWSSIVKAPQLQSTIATGTAPLIIASTTVVPNLNADMVDGIHGTALAPLASPALTGTPTAPTASPGTNTTQIATTAFVTAAVSGAGSNAGTLDGIDSTGFFILAGQAGGQTAYGGTGASQNLTLSSTASGTKGTIIIQDVLAVGTYMSATGISGTQNNWALGQVSYAHVTSTGSFNVTGIASMGAGAYFTLRNKNTSYSIALLHESTSSTATNRFNLPGGQNYFLNAGESVELFYAPDISRWVVKTTTAMRAINSDKLGNVDYYYYARLNGIPGGQSMYGGTLSNDSLFLYSTSGATKGAVVLADAVAFSSQTSAYLGSTVNNHALGANASLRVYNWTDTLLTGMTSVATGQVVIIINDGPYDLYLMHENVGSTTNNRFLMPDSTDYKIKPTQSASVYWSVQHSRWVLTHPTTAGSLDASTLDGIDSTGFAILAGQASGQIIRGGTSGSGQGLQLAGNADDYFYGNTVYIGSGYLYCYGNSGYLMGQLGPVNQMRTECVFGESVYGNALPGLLKIWRDTSGLPSAEPDKAIVTAHAYATSDTRLYVQGEQGSPVIIGNNEVVADKFISFVTPGTPPISVNSSDVCPNLNASYVNGFGSDDLVLWDGRNGGQDINGGTAFGENLALYANTTAGIAASGASIHIGSPLQMVGQLGPLTISANTHNYAPTNLRGATHLLLAATTGGLLLTGLSSAGATQNGRLFYIINDGSFDITLTHNDTVNSTSSNCFYLPGLVSYVLKPNYCMILMYNTNFQKWYMVGSSTAAPVVAAGLAGGQVIVGGTAASENLTLQSTSNATRGSINAADNFNMQSGMLLSGDITPATWGANQNDYNPTGLATAAVLRISSSSNYQLTGIAGGTDGRVLTLINIGSIAVYLAHDSVSSTTAANRMYLPENQSYVLNIGASVTLWYDTTVSRWRLQSNSGQFAQLMGGIGGQSIYGANAQYGSPGLNLYGGAGSGRGYVGLNDGIALRGIVSAAQFTGDQVDYNPTSVLSNVYRISSDAERSIHSWNYITNESLIILVKNVGSYPIIFKHESASGTSVYRFNFSSKKDYILRPGAILTLYRNTTDARWDMQSESSEAAYPPGHRNGMLWSRNATDIVNDVDISGGTCRSDDDTANIIVTSGLTKRLDATFTAGNNGGGLDTGARAANQGYYIWAILNPATLATDYLLSISPTSPTMPSGYTKKRCIGHIATEATNLINAVTYNSNGGIYVQFLDVNQVSVSYSSASLGTARVNFVVLWCPTFPAGVASWVLCDMRINAACATLGAIVTIQNPSMIDYAPNDTTLIHGAIRCNVVNQLIDGHVTQSYLATTQQLSVRSSQASTTLRVQVIGYHWPMMY